VAAWLKKTGSGCSPSAVIKSDNVLLQHMVAIAGKPMLGMFFFAVSKILTPTS